jgi:hypothetical protein
MAQPPPEVLNLIQRFHDNRDAYKSTHYNEAQLRFEFLDPLFLALGWDVYNKDGLAEAYKDVVHEDAIKVGEATKAPDYCFRIGGTRKFFLEAIRPINADNTADKTRRDQVAQLAEQMLTLHQRQSSAKTPQEKTALERQIAATDTQLDKLVYALYGLSDAEIKIVEGATA